MTQISVITPSYNQAQFISKCLTSVQAQGEHCLEHIIFDGGSSDGSASILEAYARENPNVLLKVGQDTGQANAINQGFERASGDIVAWLNTDDFYVSRPVCADIAKLFDAHPNVDVIYGKGRFIDTDGKVLREAFVYSDASKLETKFIHSVGILQPALFFRRALFQRIGPLDESLTCAFDYEYWVRMIKSGAGFMFYNKLLADATFHEQAKTTALRATQLRESIDVVKRHYGFGSTEWIKRTVECELYGVDGIVRTVDSAGVEQKDSIYKPRFEQLYKEYNLDKEASLAILSCSQKKGALATREMLTNMKMCDAERIIVTTFDQYYFRQGITMIAGVHRYTSETLPIFIYDLGLNDAQRSFLRGLHNVYVLSYPTVTEAFFDGYLAPKNYAYKCAAMRYIRDYAEDGSLILWIDAGVRPMKHLAPVFELIENDQVFFVDHDDKLRWPFLNVNCTHQQALRGMNATNHELLGEHLCSCLMGYRAGGSFQALFDDAYRYSQAPSIVVGDKHLGHGKAIKGRIDKEAVQIKRRLMSDSDYRENYDQSELYSLFSYFGHRQDQSIYSLLAARYNAPISSATAYCVSNDQSSEASKLNWYSGKVSEDIAPTFDVDISMNPEAVTYHHRGVFMGFEGIEFDIQRKPSIIVLGNGPSLKGFDFKRFNNFDVIGMNAAYRYWQLINWYPTYYICLDKIVGLSHKDEISELIEDSEANGIKLFMLRDNLIRELGALSTHPRILNFDELKHCYQLFQPMPITTGSHAALWGAAMGYPNVYLLGVDCNYTEIIPGAEEKGGTVLELTDAADNNPNYFFSGYQQKGDRYNIPNSEPDLHLNSWRSAARAIESFGVRALNANLASKVDAFDFCRFEELEQGVLPAVILKKDVLGESVDEASASSSCSLSAGGLYSGPFILDDKASINEYKFIDALYTGSSRSCVMLDLDGRNSHAILPFAQRGWQVITAGVKLLGHQDIRGRYGCVQGYAGEAGMSVKELCRQYSLSRIDFLNISSPGLDSSVLQSVPWEHIKPKIVRCSFKTEDRKDISEFANELNNQGYWVLLSEWHEKSQRGSTYWLGFKQSPCELSVEKGSANLLAFSWKPEKALLDRAVEYAIDSETKGHKAVTTAVKNTASTFGKGRQLRFFSVANRLGRFAKWCFSHFRRRIWGIGGLALISVVFMLVVGALSVDTGSVYFIGAGLILVGYGLALVLVYAYLSMRSRLTQVFDTRLEQKQREIDELRAGLDRNEKLLRQFTERLDAIQSTVTGESMESMEDSDSVSHIASRQ